jgi:hypothetical protein
LIFSYQAPGCGESTESLCRGLLLRNGQVGVWLWALVNDTELDMTNRCLSLSRILDEFLDDVGIEGIVIRGVCNGPGLDGGICRVAGYGELRTASAFRSSKLLCLSCVVVSDGRFFVLSTSFTSIPTFQNINMITATTPSGSLGTEASTQNIITNIARFSCPQPGAASCSSRRLQCGSIPRTPCNLAPCPAPPLLPARPPPEHHHRRHKQFSSRPLHPPAWLEALARL